MFVLRRKLPDLCIAHRLSKHKGLCKFVHGHNYKVFITLSSDTLDDQGMVIDFGEIKKFGDQLKAEFDHTTVISEEDSLFKSLQKQITRISREGTLQNYPFGRLQSVSFDPTVEELCRFFFDFAVKFFKHSAPCIEVNSITMFETDDSSCTYSREVKD